MNVKIAAIRYAYADFLLNSEYDKHKPNGKFVTARPHFCRFKQINDIYSINKQTCHFLFDQMTTVETEQEYQLYKIFQRKGMLTYFIRKAKNLCSVNYIHISLSIHNLNPS